MKAWQAAFDAATSAFCRGDFARAEREYLRAVKVSERLGPADPRRVQSLHQAARAAHARGRIESARELLERAVQIVLPEGTGDVELSSARRTLGLLYWGIGRPQDAAHLFLQVLESRQRRLGVSHPNAALALRDVARALSRAGEQARAIELFEQVLERLPHDDGARALTLREQGDAYSAIRTFDAALACYEKALSLEETRSPSLEEAALLGRIADARRSSGRIAFDDLVALQRRRVALLESLLGPFHVELCAPLHELSTTFEAFERWDDASETCARLLGIEEQLGDGEALASSLLHLARLREKQGRPVEAIAALERAAGLSNEEQLTVVLSRLARLCLTVQRKEEAEALLRRSIALEEGLHGPRHPDVAMRLEELARLLEGDGRFEEARVLRQRVVDIALQTFGDHDPTVAAHLCHLAHVYDALGDFEHAVPIHARALELWEALVGSESAEASACRERLHAAMNRRVVSREGAPSQ